MLAVALGRPLGINDADCDVEYPVEVDDDHLAEYFAGNPSQQERPLMTGFVLLVKLYQIAGRILREVYDLELCKENLESEQKADLAAKVEGLDAELTQWCEGLPPHFKNQQRTNSEVSISSVLCSHYYSVLTTLHRNLLPLKEGDQPIAPKSTIKAVSSARSCIRLAPSIKNVVPPSHHVAFFLQHLFSSSVILLLYAMHAPSSQASFAALEESQTALDALDSWEGLWPGAKKCKEFLVELTTTAREAVQRKKFDTSIVRLGSPQQAAAGRPTPPTTASPTMLEGSGKRTVKISTGNRRPGRRGQSKESAPSDRRLSAVSPYRSDGESFLCKHLVSVLSHNAGRRPRSGSRKRAYDDSGESQLHSPYALSFSHSAEGSAHSSPEAFSHTSPTTHSMEQQQHHLGSSNPYTVTPPISPSQGYPFEPYSAHPSSGWGTTTESVPQQAGDGSYDATEHSQYNDIYSGGTPFSQHVENSFSYDQFDQSFSGGLSTTVPVPSASFSAPGLPFRGLDYIRNFNQDQFGNGTEMDTGTSGSGMNTAATGGAGEFLWNNASYDPGAFELNPDVPFSLVTAAQNPNNVEYEYHGV